MALTKGMFREFWLSCTEVHHRTGHEGYVPRWYKYFHYFHYIVHNIRLIIYVVYAYIPLVRLIYSQAHASSINITGRVDHF